MADKYTSYIFLPVEIQKLGKNIGRNLLRSIGAEPARLARAEFDRLSANEYAISGKKALKIRIGYYYDRARDVYTWALYASLRQVPIERFPIRPDISTNTTGANRQPIYFSIKKGVWEYVDRGFIWDGLILRRKSHTPRPLERVFVHNVTKSMAAKVLHEYRISVTNVLEKAVSKAIDDELKARV